VADAELLHALNRDIWDTFRDAYAAQDIDAFMALNAPELIRAGGPLKEVKSFDGYAAETAQWFADLTSRGDGIAIEFRFVERIASADLASERGIFQITATRPGAPDKIFYGKFHTFARNVAGRWRVVADYDSNEGGTVTEETFLAATPIDDVAAFGS